MSQASCDLCQHCRHCCLRRLRVALLAFAASLQASNACSSARALLPLTTVWLVVLVSESRVTSIAMIRVPPTHASSRAGDLWAVLIAGSAGYGNYRHQADICHVRPAAQATGRCCMHPPGASVPSTQLPLPLQLTHHVDHRPAPAPLLPGRRTRSCGTGACGRTASSP